MANGEAKMRCELGKCGYPQAQAASMANGEAKMRCELGKYRVMHSQGGLGGPKLARG